MSDETAKQGHTPGPWKVSEFHRTVHQATASRDSCSVIIANMPLFTGPGYSKQFNEANTRLIAAAPELLEACRLALDAARYVVSICEADVIAGESAVPTQKSCPNEVLANAYAAMSFSVGVSAAIANAEGSNHAE